MICRKCQRDLDETDFGFDHRARKDGTRRRLPRCNGCRSAVSAAKYDAGKAHQRYIEHREIFLATARKTRLSREYDITPEQYDAMLAAQGSHCAICPATEPGRRLSFFCVDHDHVTGEVRGLLCHDCNLMLGNAKDSEERLGAAIRYLRKSRRPTLEVVNA